MDSSSEGSQLKQWLGNSENHEWLSYRARAIYNKLEQRKTLSAFLGSTSGSDESRQDALAVIESELVVFLLEKEAVFTKFIGAGDNNFSRYLEAAFINHCGDIARRKTENPGKYLYKRLSDALRQAEQFFTRTPQSRLKRLEFSCSRQNRRIVPLTREDLMAVGFPAQKIGGCDYDTVNRNTALLELAEHFWNEISQMQGGRAVWISVWDVIEWIGLHVRLDVSGLSGEVEPGRLPQPTARDDDHTDQQRWLEHLSDGENEPDKVYFDHNVIKKWAGSFAARLNTKEKTICYFSWGLDLGLEEIAKKLGYSGASGPHYLLKQVEDRLREFLRDLDWLASDDLNETAFAFFMDSLLSILKNAVSEP